MDEEITVRQGEHITIQLPATNRWSVVARDDNAVLQPIEPLGAPDAQGQMLEWRYIAVRQGSATLTFSGRPSMRPGTKMPHYVVARTYTVTVTP
jgi:hypothetical protein